MMPKQQPYLPPKDRFYGLCLLLLLTMIPKRGRFYGPFFGILIHNFCEVDDLQFRMVQLVDTYTAISMLFKSYK